MRSSTEPDSEAAATDVDRSFWASVKRISRTLLVGSAIAASLLAFPSVLPWMLGGWILWHTVLMLRGGAAYLPLATCLVLMIVKLVPRTPSILLFACLLLLVAWMRRRGARRETLNRPKLRAMTIALWIAWGLVYVQWQRNATHGGPLTLDPQRPIVCIGDSLTQGMLPDPGFPAQLQKLVRVPVINSGFSGIATTQGLGQLPRALEHHPQVVVIELGGHDFLQGIHGRAATKRNLVKMISMCRANDAEVVLMEIPRGFMFDPFASLEREIAYEQDVQLVSDTAIRQLVFWSPIAPPGMWFPDSQLSDDGIHSNPRGSEAMAGYVAEGLEQMYGPAILK